MAKRKVPNQDADSKQTLLIVGKEYFQEELNKRIQLGEEINARQIQTDRQFQQAKDDFYSWDDFNSELLKQSFNKPDNEYREQYDNVNRKFIYVSKSPAEELQEFIEDVKNKVNNLKQLVAKISLIKSEIKETTISISESNTNKVFIVHGHNNEVKVNVARTIEKLGLEAIILHEQPNTGKTIIEKFEQHSDVSFAVVLLTDDD